VLLNPDFEEVKAGIAEFKPTFLYLCGHTTYDQNKAYGNITGLQFRGGSRIQGLPWWGPHLHGWAWVMPMKPCKDIAPCLCPCRRATISRCFSCGLRGAGDRLSGRSVL
jgi:hypothetical protein